MNVVIRTKYDQWKGVSELYCNMVFENNLSTKIIFAHYRIRVNNLYSFFIRFWDLFLFLQYPICLHCFLK